MPEFTRSRAYGLGHASRNQPPRPTGASQMSLLARVHRPVRKVLRAMSGSEEYYGTTSRYVQYEGEAASDLLNAAISSKQPFMAARFGGNELDCVVDYMNALSWR